MRKIKARDLLVREKKMILFSKQRLTRAPPKPHFTPYFNSLFMQRASLQMKMGYFYWFYNIDFIG